VSEFIETLSIVLLVISAIVGPPLAAMSLGFDPVEWWQAHFGETEDQ
jgi:hypothetical protein